MPSHLRLETSIDPIAASASYLSAPPAKKARTAAKMTLTQTYYVASTARSKLGREAARADHNLRRLVGHANMLDRLMVELSHAEAEQEAWFHASVRTADEPRRVQWIDSIAEEEDEEEEDAVYDESDNESDVDESEEAEMFNIPLRRLKSPPIQLGATHYDDEDAVMIDEEDEDEEDEQPASHSPPELTYDDSDSEEEMPSSPRNLALKISEKERQAIVASAALFPPADVEVEDFASRQQPAIAAC